MASRRDGTKVTSPELAELFDCDPRTIQILAKDGIVVRSGRGEYLLDLSVRRYVVHLREQAAGRSAARTVEGEKLDPVVENAMLKREQRRNYELKNAVLEGTMIPYDRLRRVAAEIAAIADEMDGALPPQPPSCDELVSLKQAAIVLGESYDTVRIRAGRKGQLKRFGSCAYVWRSWVDQQKSVRFVRSVAEQDDKRA